MANPSSPIVTWSSCCTRCCGWKGCSRYWVATELPRVGVLAAPCRGNDDSYARAEPDWF